MNDRQTLMEGVRSVEPYFVLQLTSEFAKHVNENFSSSTAHLLRQAGSVTRWLDYFSIFGHLQQWQMAQ